MNSPKLRQAAPIWGATASIILLATLTIAPRHLLAQSLNAELSGLNY
jgi:hypothetical protein